MHVQNLMIKHDDDRYPKLADGITPSLAQKTASASFERLEFFSDKIGKNLTSEAFLRSKTSLYGVVERQEGRNSKRVLVDCRGCLRVSKAPEEESECDQNTSSDR